MIVYWLRHRGAFFPVYHTDCLLGRSSECLIVLASERVSREHAVVRRTHRGIEIEDLGSRNGTWLNGRRIGAATALKKGDRIQLGDDQLEVVLEPNVRAPETVSGVATSASLEAKRQRDLLARLDAALAGTDEGAANPGGAQTVRGIIDSLLGGAGAWGLLLPACDAARLTEAARIAAGWVGSDAFERWSEGVERSVSAPRERPSR